MKERFCASCGEAIEAEQARFCQHCGAVLPEETVEQDAEKLETAIREKYYAYGKWAEGFLAKERGGRRLLNLFTSNSPFKNSEEHGKFFEDVKGMTEELLAAYQAKPGTGDLAGLLHFVLIKCHGITKVEADWMFLAAEQLYLPFLDLLSARDASALFLEYKQLRRKNKGFEFQTKILKMLKAMGNK